MTTKPRVLKPVKKLAVQLRECTDVGNKDRLVDHIFHNWRYLPSGYFGWCGNAWLLDDLGFRQAAMDVLSRSIYLEAASASDRSEQNELGQWAKDSQQAPRIRAAIYLAQPYFAASVDDFDKQPGVIFARNVCIDSKTGETSPHCRENFNTGVMPVDYTPAQGCRVFLRFLDRVQPDPKMQAFLRRAVGYTLTGYTSEQCIFFLFGVGRNGKSVFMEIIAELMGPSFHTAMRIQSLCIKNGNGASNDMAATAGKRYLTSAETPEGAKLDEPLIKGMAGGDTLAARLLFKEYFSFRSTGKLWICGNHKPQIRGTDDGIWRRLMLVPFNVQIPESEVDSSLLEQLKAELPGILNWALEGCRDWHANGLQPPQIVKDAVAGYRKEMDVLGEFISTCCVVGDHLTVGSTPLYLRYRKWCDIAGHSPVSQTRLGKSLGERGFTGRKIGRVWWHGIGLADIECQRCDGDGCEWCLGGDCEQ